MINKCMLVVMALTASSVLQATPILYSDTVSTFFNESANVTYTVTGTQTGNNPGIVWSNTGFGTAYSATGTFTDTRSLVISGYLKPTSLVGNQLFLDLSNSVTFGAYTPPSGVCSFFGNGHCGSVDPTFTPAPKALFISVSSNGTTLTFVAPNTTSATNLDISTLANDFIAGDPFTIDVTVQDTFTANTTGLDGNTWHKSHKTYSVGQQVTGSMGATIHGHEDVQPPTQTPEPYTFPLVGSGLILLGLLARRFSA